MYEKGLGFGKHHWDSDDLFNNTKKLLKSICRKTFKDISDTEVWLAVLMLYPNMGTKETRDGKKRRRSVC